MATAGISCSNVGTNQIVAADMQASRRISVRAYMLVAANPVSVQWADSAGNTYSGQINLVAGLPVILPACPSYMSGRHEAWFSTASGTALYLNLSAGVQVSGHLLYELEF